MCSFTGKFYFHFYTFSGLGTYGGHQLIQKAQLVLTIHRNNIYFFLLFRAIHSRRKIPHTGDFESFHMFG